MTRNLIPILTLMAMLISPLGSIAWANDYVIDQSHSSISFKVRHLVGKVRGDFNKFEGTFAYKAGKPKAWKTEAVIDVRSIDTNNENRDKHLRGKDFFFVEKFSKMTFKSKEITDLDDDEAKLHGTLTIRGVTKPVVLDLEIGGTGTDPYGNQKAAFTATTKINRKDFGLTWNEALETGGLLVGEEIEIILEIEGNLQTKEKSKKKK